MRILILGGTVFVGRHLVEAALERGHQVTLFNRGQTNPGLFAGRVKEVRGDRETDLSALDGGMWDAAIDTAGYVPRIVRKAADFLAPHVKHYTFISSISVFAGFARKGIDEAGELGALNDPATEEVSGETYGPLKAACEREVEAAMPGRALIIRPGLIVGPDDPTDRFTYWPERIARGGEVLAPEGPDVPVQFIDVRDLADWNIRLIEGGVEGTFNATGPERPLMLGEVLEWCRTESGSNATVTYVPEAFLKQHNVQPWMELPLWVGEGDPPGSMAGFAAIDCRKAIAAGLTFRPLAETIRETLIWNATRPTDAPRRAGLPAEREAGVLAAWREARSG